MTSDRTPKKDTDKKSSGRSTSNEAPLHSEFTPLSPFLPGYIGRLQQSVGNRAVQKMLASNRSKTSAQAFTSPLIKSSAAKQTDHLNRTPNLFGTGPLIVPESPLIVRNAPAVSGPLPEGTVKEYDDGLVVQQYSQNEVEISRGESRIHISGSHHADEGYRYEISEPSSTGERVVRITSTLDVMVDKHLWGELSEEGAMPLVVHEKKVEKLEDVSTEPGLFEELNEFTIIGANKQPVSTTITLDSSDISIHAHDDDPNSRYAYYIEPNWSGAEGKERVVNVVATPGVEVDDELPDLSIRHGIAGFQRKLVLHLARVQDPSLVPSQGTPIYPEDYVGFVGVFSLDSDESPMGVFIGSQGITVKHEWSGATLAIYPRNAKLGAHFAYQVVAPTSGSSGEIRAVVGPGTIVDLAEPRPMSYAPFSGKPEAGEALEEQGVELHLFEVDDPAQVPKQGSEINVSEFESIGRRRQPDHHTIIESVGETIALAAADTGLSLIPIVGDLIDIAEFVYAVATGEDRWGRPVADWELGVMGIGVLLPFVGGGTLRGVTKAGSKLAQAASRTGRSLDEIEVLLSQVRRLPADEQSEIRRLEGAIKQGEEMPETIAKRARAMLDNISEQALLLPPPAQLRQALGTPSAIGELMLKYPFLFRYGLDQPALERIWQKANNVQQAKGQLLEELMESKVRTMLDNEAQMTALLGQKVEGKLEYIPGHMITDQAGQQLTDGIIGVRGDDGVLKIVGIFESKAGKASSRGLGYSYKPLKDMTPGELKEARAYAIDLLLEEKPHLQKLSREQLEKKYRKRINKIMRDLPKAEAGQVRKDIERLAPGADEASTTILVNGKPEQVYSGPRSTRVLGVAPSDVNLEKLADRMKGEKLNFGQLDIDIDQAQLDGLAQDLVDLKPPDTP